jgi:DNA-binding IclR family transcriptional regulator
VGAALAGRVDDDGVAERRGAVEADVTAVSAPVRGPGFKVVAALSVVGPTYRLSGALLAQTRRLVAEHALRLSHLAGGDSLP